MIFIAIIIAALIVYVVQYKYYEKHMLENIEYDVSLSAEEVFEDEDIFLYEEITNDKYLPLPYIKVDTQLPDGLKFLLYDADPKNGSRIEKLSQNIRSIFVMHSKQKIRRKWRVRCLVRGTYVLDRVLIVGNDIVGFNQQSKSVEVKEGRHNRIVVLPKAIDLEKYFNLSRFYSGDVIVNRSLITDPLLKAGTREYSVGDPMNKINWKSTAVHNKLMVNVEEFTQRFQFNMVLNMQSRDIEPLETEPSTPAYVEQCITIAASIFDKISSDNIPIRLISNTPPETVDGTLCADEDDEIGSQILRTQAYEGKRDIIEALRLLAQLQMKISVPIEKMLDHILNNAAYYSENGNIVFISAYISERMINFSREMQKQGVNVIFYVTTSYNNAMVIPPDVDVYFKTDIEY